MQGGNCLRVRTIAATHFIGAIAGGGNRATEDVDPTTLAAKGGGAGLNAGKHCRCRIHEIRILSSRQIAWAIELYGTAAGPANANIDLVTVLGRFEFAAADGKKDAGETHYKYWVPGLDLSYEDLDQTGKFHIQLINIDPGTNKLSHAGGDDVVVELVAEPTQGI